MKKHKRKFKAVIWMVIGVVFILSTPVIAEADYSLTPEEKAYIGEKNVIVAVSIDGIAPIQYRDANGEVQGISKLVLDEIAEMTGLIFEYRLYDSLDEALKSNFDIFFGMPYHYAPDGMVLSHPFLKTETILYLNSALDFNQLYDKRFAAVKDSALPEGGKGRNAIYYDTREESMDAVERGEADYGYGNAYSVTFYTLQNDYRNIVTIPKGKEAREYCMGLSEKNDLLLSILNKKISEIDENRMQQLVLDATLHVERKVSFSMLMDSYGKEIFAVVLVIIGILLFSVVNYVRMNRRLRMQNKRKERLSYISNEYLYEYFPGADRLELSEKCIGLFETPEALEESVSQLKKMLAQVDCDGHMSTITLPISNGESGVFKAINSCIHDDNGKLNSVIGKLIDVSAEVAEKEELLLKSQADGLTGLYNAVTTKELISERMVSRDKQKMDAFLLMDCDHFKEINDTFGHLIGDQILEHIGRSLKLTFRSTDIIGRIGGDEFCVYMKDIPSADFVQGKCLQLRSLIRTASEDISVSVSTGIAFVEGEMAYECIFKMADDALYQAKRNGRDQAAVYGGR